VTAEAWIAGTVGIAASVEDLARRRISNWIPAVAFAGGVCLQTAQGGWRGAGSALLGTVSGAAVFLIVYLLGGMGGGDVKLMAGFGAVLGSRRLFEAALWTAGCGGVMAVLFLLAHYLGTLWRSLRRAPKQADATGTPRPVETIPYAPAIALGVWLSLVPKS
jgi:prepilin peptidase CpaA